MDVSIIDNKIFIENNVFEFKYTIEKYIVFDDIIIVLLKGIETENVYGVDQFGKLLWQIDKHIFIKNQHNCIYTNISIYEKKIGCYNFCGFFCTIDHKTGKIINVEFSK